MTSFNRWLRSKAGRITIASVVVLALVVAGVGQLAGWWGGPGTAGLPAPQPSYPDPVGGYSCMPTCAENDGKFLVMAGTGVATFGGNETILWIGVPGNKPSFELGFFDGDAGKDDSGAMNPQNGNWDNTTTDAEVTYTLYADPLKNGEGSKIVGQWNGNADNMPNNAWFDITVNNDSAAQAPSGHYFYRLKATSALVPGYSAFKLRTSGYISAGQNNVANTSFGIISPLASWGDVHLLYPQFQDINNPGESTYSGEWVFQFYVSNDQKLLEFWDGDFDRGTSNSQEADTDDPNTQGMPAWANPQFTVDERAAGKGAPPDDNRYAAYRRSPAVQYQITDPEGVPVYTNDEPSGTEEWEKFLISTDPSVEADLTTDRIKPGLYTIYIKGLDISNAVWFRVNFEVCDPEDGCGPCVFPGCDSEACPRTIGYWKNNVNKVLINNKTKGVQESRESLEAALDGVAKSTALYRNGIDVTSPVEIANVVRLTDQEADMILQRSQKSYPGGKDQANSMLARALQQNLATWLNLASGKIADNTVVTLNVHGGPFEGTVLEALREAEDIILNGGDLERAKDIGDQINNGLLGENASDSVCTDYEPVMPKDKQPPKHKDMPKAPKPDTPNKVNVPPDPDPETCQARLNTYNVESPTNNPFYGIKFEFQSGEEIKNGGDDIFKFTLPTDVVAGMSQVQFEAKAGTNVGTAALDSCDFTSPVGCGEPVTDDGKMFAFAFLGSADNGDSTTTLTFQVYNFTANGLSHTTISLPEGQVPSTPSGNYESKVCPE